MVTTMVTATESNEKEKQEKQKAEEEAAFRFVKQYVIRQRAEMFFADKAILIEGDTERMLISAMMKKCDDSRKSDSNYMPLLSQNISVIEVGAYAKVFSVLLGFIGIKTVIFTDIDCAKKNANNRSESCRFADAALTTNASIKYFLGTEAISNIVAKTADERTFEYRAESKHWEQNNSGQLRICFQGKDNDYQSSSFEDAFLSKNLSFIVSSKESFQGLKCINELVETAVDFYSIAEKCIKSKTTLLALLA